MAFCKNVKMFPLMKIKRLLTKGQKKKGSSEGETMMHIKITNMNKKIYNLITAKD